MAIYLDKDFDLAKLGVPEGVCILEVADLSRRYREALSSVDDTVRCWGAGKLAALDPYDSKNLAAIANLLNDKDNWVRRGAVSKLPRFGKKAEAILPALRDLLGTNDKDLKGDAEEAIEEIQHSKDTAAAEREHSEMLAKISRFVKSRR